MSRVFSKSNSQHVQAWHDLQTLTLPPQEGKGAASNLEDSEGTLCTELFFD